MHQRLVASIVALSMLFTSVNDSCITQRGTQTTLPSPSPLTIQPAAPSAEIITPTVFLPVMTFTPPPVISRRANIPYFGTGSVLDSEAAIFWFGKVDMTSNYADVRIGYNNTELFVQILIFDRRLWYNPTPATTSLTAWDSTSLYLRLGGNTGSTPDQNTYRFDAQAVDWERDRTNWQAAYRGNGSGWSTANTAFTTESGYQWESVTVGGFNNGQNNRGWVITYHIPFSSLGLSTRPTQETIWGLGVVVHDRDDAAGTSIPDQLWPETLNTSQPKTWGQIHYGLPVYSSPSVTSRQTMTISQGWRGAIVPDAAVGGSIGNLCPGDPTFIWNDWANMNFGAAVDFNIQNQTNVADWPCFAKYYITFPLDSLPANKAIVSAMLTLHQWGGSDQTQAYDSLIQAFTIGDDWDPSTLTWNNAPLALENVSRTWVGVLPSEFAGWPGVPNTWDISQALAQAYATGQPLRLAIYEADIAMHSGKYFTSSDAENWDAEGRPTLSITYGNP